VGQKSNGRYQRSRLPVDLRGRKMEHILGSMKKSMNPEKIKSIRRIRIGKKMTKREGNIEVEKKIINAEQT